MGQPRMRDELRHHVDAGHVDTKRLEVGDPVARSAAEVEHAADQPRQVPLDDAGVVLAR